LPLQDGNQAVPKEYGKNDCLIPSSMYGCKANSLFAVKALMKLSPFKFNTIVMLLSIVIFGQALRICEAPLVRITQEMDHYDFGNSMWAIILTMTTGNFKI